MDPAELSALVKGTARELGFDACGVAEASPIDLRDHLGRWLQMGYQADMNWFERSKAVRQDPREWLPGAKSVIVLAKNYFAPRPERLPGQAVVSRYAWGADYHKVLKEPLRQLAARITEWVPGAKCVTSVDTGPVMEKAWAVRAGLGWQGKNTLLIHPQFGSWLFLCTIATMAGINSDTALATSCGKCARCMDACPAGALAEPGVLDARKCISYQTVENRGAIPEALAPSLGANLFGCDLCQEACPHNRAAVATTEPAFRPADGTATPDIGDLSSLTEVGFAERYKDSPLKRMTYAGFRRNLAIVKKNTAEDVRIDRDETACR